MHIEGIGLVTKNQLQTIHRMAVVKDVDGCKIFDFRKAVTFPQPSNYVKFHNSRLSGTQKHFVSVSVKTFFDRDYCFRYQNIF